MIPPVVTSTPTYRSAAPVDATVRADDARGLAQAPGRAIRPELPTAVEAARRAAALQKLRDEDRQPDAAVASAPAGQDPPRDAPTGPPPTFDETPLERQVRTAFDPPDLSVTVEDSPAVEASDPTADTAQENDAPAPGPSQAPADRPTFAASVPQGFREVASDFSRSTPSKVDAKA